MIKGALFLILILFFAILTQPMVNLEGFTTFDECRQKGYTSEFCVQTPVAFGGPASCQCLDGSLGIIAPGWRGACLC